MAETEFSPLPEELSPILDSLIDAVIILDTDGRIAGWNSVAEETFGWTMPQSLGQLLAEMIIPVEFRAAHQDGMRRVLAGGDPHVLNRRADGAEAHAKSTVARNYRDVERGRKLRRCLARGAEDHLRDDRLGCRPRLPGR